MRATELKSHFELTTETPYLAPTGELWSVHYETFEGNLLRYNDTTLYTWWRHPMEIFFALLAICVGNSPVTGELPAQRPVTRSFDVFFDVCLNKRLSKQWWGWWLETPSRPLWRHSNDVQCFFDRTSQPLAWIQEHVAWCGITFWVWSRTIGLSSWPAIGESARCHSYGIYLEGAT